MRKTTRRQFLTDSGKGLAGVAMGSMALSALNPRRVMGANERVRVALIGCGGRGRYVARGMVERGAELAYLCDLHPDRLAETAKFLEDVVDKAPKQTREMREVLDDKNVDGVIVATPDVWHAPATVLACQAGKDVYVEKPHSHDIWESRQMIEAARKYDRIVQVGTQNRSAPYNQEALKYIESGKVGKIPLVKVYNLKPGGPFTLGEPGEKPEGFDWDKWLGTAPYRPYHERIFYGGWHKYWDYCGGDMADDGIHQVDLAFMLMGNPGVPKAVSCSGGRLVWTDDDAEVPDTQVVTFEFDGFVMTFELSGYPRYMRKTTGTIRRNDIFPYWTQNATRIELYGSDLLLTVGRHGGGWQAMTSGGKVEDQMYGRFPDADHQQNYLECIKSRKKPNADIEILHPSVCAVHMGNIAYRVGNKKLYFDAENERFIDNDDANKLVRQVHREKYGVPEKV